MPVDIQPDASAGSGTSTSTDEGGNAELAIISRDRRASFLPKFSPETVRARRKRTLNRTPNFCKGEDVTDNGSKNYEIHATGRLVGPEKQSVYDVADKEIPLDFTSATWSGEIRIKEVEVDGPVGWNPQSGYFHYKYTIDAVSTGAEFRDSSSGNGIIQDGTGAEASGSIGFGSSE